MLTILYYTNHTIIYQACTLVSAGDVFAQLIELRAAHKGKDDSPLAYGSRLERLCGFPLQGYEKTRTARMGVLGLFIGGIGTAAWLRYIENTLPLRDSHEYSAYTNLPTWVYAPLLRLFQLEGVDQAVVAECAALPTPRPPRLQLAVHLLAQRRRPFRLQHGAGDRQSSRRRVLLGAPRQHWLPRFDATLRGQERRGGARHAARTLRASDEDRVVHVLPV